MLCSSNVVAAAYVLSLQCREQRLRKREVGSEKSVRRFRTSTGSNYG